MVKTSGNRTEPCGTLYQISQYFDYWLELLTLCQIKRKAREELFIKSNEICYSVQNNKSTSFVKGMKSRSTRGGAIVKL